MSNSLTQDIKDYNEAVKEEMTLWKSFKIKAYITRLLFTIEEQ